MDIALATVILLIIVFLALGTMWEIPVNAEWKFGRFQPITIRASIFVVLFILSSAFIVLPFLKLS